VGVEMRCVQSYEFALETATALQNTVKQLTGKDMQIKFPTPAQVKHLFFHQKKTIFSHVFFVF
jgi:hypothetical protein